MVGSLSLRNVPVLACGACGEVYLDPDTARQLDTQFRRLMAAPVEYVVGQFETPPTAAYGRGAKGPPTS